MLDEVKYSAIANQTNSEFIIFEASSSSSNKHCWKCKMLLNLRQKFTFRLRKNKKSFINIWSPRKVRWWISSCLKVPIDFQTSALNLAAKQKPKQCCKRRAKWKLKKKTRWKSFFGDDARKAENENKITKNIIQNSYSTKIRLWHEC